MNNRFFDLLLLTWEVELLLMHYVAHIMHDVIRLFKER